MAFILRCLPASLPLRTAILPLFLAVLVLAAPAQVPSPGGAPAFRAELFHPNASALSAHLNALGYDAHAHGNHLDLVLSEDEEEALQDAGLFPTRGAPAMPLRDRLFYRDVLPSGYRDLAAITAHLQNLAATYPNLVSFHDAASEWGPGATFEGRAIPVIKISDQVQQDEDEPEVLFVSAHHCREIITPEIALELADLLVLNYASDPAIRALVDRYEIWIAPIWNPDGLEYVWNVNELWRKNRRPVGGGAVGVDLNRNYPLGFDAGCGGSTNPSSATYRGPSAASEAETQTMIAFARDRRFAKVMDYHSSGREVLLGYLCSQLPPTIDAFIDAEGIALANAVPSPPGYGTRSPSAEGEHQTWQIAEHTSYAFLTETGTEFQPSHAAALAEAALVIPSALAFLARDVPLTGRVTSLATGLAVEATLSVQGINWVNGETRKSEPRFGRYHLFLPAGTYTITAEAPGFAPQTGTVSVGATGTALLDFQLSAPFELSLQTSGGGLGDLQISLTSPPATAVEGYMLLSFQTALPAGSGPLFGLWPDRTTFDLSLTRPAAPGDLFHWTLPAALGLWPQTGFQFPPGTLPLPPGTTLDALALVLGPGASSFAVTPLVRVTF